MKRIRPRTKSIIVIVAGKIMHKHDQFSVLLFLQLFQPGQKLFQVVFTSQDMDCIIVFCFRNE